MKISNPMTITKETAPYLYLTDSSGIYLNGYGLSTRNIMIPINPQESADFMLTGLQMWIRAEMPDANCTIMRIDNNLIGIELSADVLSDAGRIMLSTAVDSIDVYINGGYVKDPYIMPGEWTAINMVFNEPVAFTEVASPPGYMLLYPGFLFNNISLFSYETDPSTIAAHGMQSANIYDDLVGTSTIVVNDISTTTVFANGVDIFTNIKWQTLEQKLV